MVCIVAEVAAVLAGRPEVEPALGQVGQPLGAHAGKAAPNDATCKAGQAQGLPLTASTTSNLLQQLVPPPGPSVRRYGMLLWGCHSWYDIMECIIGL